MGRLDRWRSLCAADRRLVLMAFLTVAAIRALLWLLPSRTQARLLARFFQEGFARPAGADFTLPERIAWAVGLAGRYIPRATCLTQALAATVLLHREGLPAVMQLGVKKDASGQFQAHAWVEPGDGLVIDGCNQAGYTPLRPIIESPTKG